MIIRQGCTNGMEVSASIDLSRLGRYGAMWSFISPYLPCFAFQRGMQVESSRQKWRWIL